MSKKWLFDRPWTKDFTEVRKGFLAEFLESTRRHLTLTSALDVGCALGDFSQFLHGLGFRVMGADGRQENAAEAKRRYPDISFITADAEDLPVAEMGRFDLVLCLGLLYHLENPFRTIRQLHSLTDKVLVIEAMYLPGSGPVMALFDECADEDQSLNSVAFYPSEPCLIKMLYRAGFPFVYRLKKPPPHGLFTGTIWRKPVRTILIASKAAITLANLLPVPEHVLMPPDTSNPWAAAEWDPWSTPFLRVGRFGNRRVASIRAFGARVLRPFRTKR